MKLIIAVLLLAIGAFAQNTKYMDGTDCYCDSIHTSNYVNNEYWEEPYVNGKLTGIEYWYVNDKLRRTAELLNGLRHGNTTMYDNDTISMVITYVNGFETKEVGYGSITTYEYNKKGQLIKEYKYDDKYSYSSTVIYTYTKTIRTRKYFYNGNISAIYVNKYKMINRNHEKIKSNNIELGELLSETHYNEYGNISGNAVIEDGKILYYVCSTGKMVTYAHKCE